MECATRLRRHIISGVGAALFLAARLLRFNSRTMPTLLASCAAVPRMCAQTLLLLGTVLQYQQDAQLDSQRIVQETCVARTCAVHSAFTQANSPVRVAAACASSHVSFCPCRYIVLRSAFSFKNFLHLQSSPRYCVMSRERGCAVTHVTCRFSATSSHGAAATFQPRVARPRLVRVPGASWASVLLQRLRMPRSRQPAAILISRSGHVLCGFPVERHTMIRDMCASQRCALHTAFTREALCRSSLAACALSHRATTRSCTSSCQVSCHATVSWPLAKIRRRSLMVMPEGECCTIVSGAASGDGSAFGHLSHRARILSERVAAFLIPRMPALLLLGSVLQYQQDAQLDSQRIVQEACVARTCAVRSAFTQANSPVRVAAACASSHVSFCPCRYIVLRSAFSFKHLLHRQSSPRYCVMSRQRGCSVAPQPSLGRDQSRADQDYPMPPAWWLGCTRGHSIC